MWKEFQAIVHVSRKKFGKIGKMSNCDAALVESWLSSFKLQALILRLSSTGCSRFVPFRTRSRGTIAFIAANVL